jgi:hypothetical protein
VHGVDQTKAFGHATPVNQFLDLRELGTGSDLKGVLPKSV